MIMIMVLKRKRKIFNLELKYITPFYTNMTNYILLLLLLMIVKLLQIILENKLYKKY